LVLDPFELLALVVVFFFTSVISVVTGSTSLITVPIMLQFGIEPRTAVATNMLALTLMSLGGSLSFYGKSVIERRRLPLLVGLTLAGSAVGAILLLVIPSCAVPFIISVFMIAVALFSISTGDVETALGERQLSRGKWFLGYAATFALGVYGGFFSGGYVTLLTAVFVAFFGMTFVRAISTTKTVNLFSSLVATLIFMWRGLVDYRLGVLLGVIMFIGAFLGGRMTLKLNNVWLRRIFLAAVVVLALKLIIYDHLFKLLIDK
jgi:hypothetical protein